MSLLLHVLLNCLPTKKCLPKQVCFIYCSSTALFVFGSHTLSCYQQPKLHKCKKWAWGKGKKEKGSLICLQSQPGTGKVPAMRSSSFHRTKQNKPRENWEMTCSAPPQASWRHCYNSLSDWDLHPELTAVCSAQFWTFPFKCFWFIKFAGDPPTQDTYTILYWNQSRFRSFEVRFNSRQPASFAWT